MTTVYIQTHSYATSQAQLRVEEFLENYKALRQYISKYQKSEIFKLQSNNIIHKDFFIPNLLSSTFGAKTVNKIYNDNRIKDDKTQIIIKFASTNPRNLLNKATPKEKSLLEQYNNKTLTDSYQEVIKTKDGTFLYYVLPTKLNEQKCMMCHSNPSLAPKELVQKYGDKNGFYEKIGNMRAILTTTMNIDSYLEFAKQRFLMVAFYITTIFLMILLIVYKFTNRLKKESELTSSILNSQKNIVVTTNGLYITNANNYFLDFFNFNSKDDFLEKYDCICELFLDRKNSYHNGLLKEDENWIDYMLQLDSDKKIVTMYNQYNQEIIFIVNFESFGKDKHHYVITFTDISELNNLKNNLENIVQEKTQELKEINENLELKVEEKTKEQGVLLSLFDLGESVLFKWNNDENWSVDYVSLSVTKLLGYDIDDFIKNKITYASCIYKNDLKTVMLEVTNASKGEQNFFKHKPYRVITKDGEIRWILDYTIIVRDEDYNITHYIGYISDITEVKEQEKKLFEQEKMVQMGEMIGNIAHQWRQPLSVVSTSVSGMKMQKEFGLLDDNHFFNSCDTIMNSTEFLSKTIETFSNFINEQKEVKEVVLQERIGLALNIINSSLKDVYIKLKDNIDYDEPIKITLVLGELSQVIINIINNAKGILLDNNVKDAWIKLELKKFEDKVIITIEDNAGGIPEDILPKIFNPYFTTKHQSQGKGLGLSMTYTIVTERLKGELYVRNTKNGAKFFIELPLS